MNIKVGFFEAVACKKMVITQHHADIAPFFSLGLEAVAYKNKDDLVDLICYYLAHEDVRSWIAANGYQRLMQEHTWEKRWQGVLEDIALFVAPQSQGQRSCSGLCE